ncbi:Efflux pump vrtL [Fulvia fulva]|uniref:Cercosporin MFS transporter CTB4 n=1 Tax=Passalora fulva TaxID=5499 RepID=A0A9Q8PM03_PASFU|nr:Efflux pump vrtL [Fulvia fulva]KAK4608916.1 Efflux pump vrtL [Fulvia fulva]UJO24996.1 Efflux pump vrtL [Fulvia fulva]WPV22949.1 Efflux pump vrtL [Fulvia fulva]WPV37666.1 Efflux pump vrtL [Fulvia fulva]
MSQTPRSTVGTAKSWNSRYTGYTGDSYDLQQPPPLEEVEQARLRPVTNDEFPWLSGEFEPIKTQNTRTRSPPQWYREGQAANQRGLSQRSQRSIPRESIVDLHLIVSDLDYYAGAVHDYQVAEEEAFEEEEDWDDEQHVGEGCKPEQQGGRPSLTRGTSNNMGRNGTLKRGPSTKSTKEKDLNLVTWDGPDDPANPKNWANRRRWLATITVSLFTFIAPVSSSMIAPGLRNVQADLHIQSDLEVEMGMSIFILGFAIGPLFLGPLSELFGRSVVLQLSNLFYMIFNLAGGFSRNSGELIAFRFLSGLGGSAPLGVGGGVLADLWLPTERGRAMALYSLMPLLGPAIGPIAGGFIAEYSTWRWVFWSTSIAAAFIQVLGMFFLQETYAAAILAKKKKLLIKITGNKDLHTEFDNPSRTFLNHCSVAFKRPFILLFTQPIVQVLSLYIFYVYGVLYLVLASFPRVWAQVYGQTNKGIAGLNYISLGLGFFIGTQIAAKFADKIYKSLMAKNNDTGRSEFRVPLMFPGAVMVPVGLFIYGWTAQYHTHWIGPNIGTAIFAAGNQLVFQNCQTYLVDSYTRYAASAIAATAVFRSLGGFAFPLFAPYMYNALGYGWGNTTLGFVGVAVGFPSPLILWWYGERLRKKSTFAAG